MTGLRARAPHRPGLRRRRALASDAPAGADRARRRRSACPTSSSTRSPTGATRSPTRRRGLPRRGRGLVRRGGAGNAPGRQRHRPLLRDGPRPAARSAPRRRVDLLVDGRPSTTRDTGAAGRPRRLRARRDRRVRRPPPPSATRRASARQDSVIAFNFRPDRMRQLTEALGAAGRALHDADRVRGGLAVAVAFPPDAPRDRR